MRQTFIVVALLTAFATLAQKEPPGLIYSCERDMNGVARYDIFNSSGQKILAQPVDWAYSNTWTWLFVMDKKTKLITVYNYAGRPLGIDSVEESQSTYTNLNRVALKRAGRWGFYNRQGKLKVAHRYDEVSHFKNGIAAVRLGNDRFMIDTNGLRVSAAYNPSNRDYSFNDMDIAIGMGGDFYNSDFKKVTENGKTGLLDVAANQLVVPVAYDKLVDLKEKFRVVTGGKSGKYGLIAFGGQVLIPLVYKSVFVLNNYF